MGLESILANGGRILVAGGRWNKGWDSWRDDPRVVWWTGEQKDVALCVKNSGGSVPDNIKGLIISRFISHSQMEPIVNDARKKRAMLFLGKNDGEVTRLLEEILVPAIKFVPPPVPVLPKLATEAAIDTKKKGWLMQFIGRVHQTELITAREGERIFKLLEARGAKTTVASCQQAVLTYRKKLGIQVGPRRNVNPRNRHSPPVTSPPAALVTRPVPKPVHVEPEPVKTMGEVEVLLTMIDEHLAGLQLIREQVVKLNKENEKYMAMRAKLQALIKE